ncbi:MAG: alanine aminotransferase [Monoraphidium minutum]|nr:MAG: alanine aminotransferase [Monoraphidium minutum]
MTTMIKTKQAMAERMPGRAAEHDVPRERSAVDQAPPLAAAAAAPRPMPRGLSAGALAALAAAPPTPPDAQAPIARLAPAGSPAGGGEAEGGAGGAATAGQLPACKEGKVLHPDLINPNIIKTQYAVRGELYLRAEALRREGRDIIFTNIGNPHNLGAKPKTFTRQVIALCAAPWLLDDPAAAALFPSDAAARARKLLAAFTGGVGSYTDSRGNLAVRQEVADFIERRDGHPANAEHIFLTDGASPAVRMCLTSLIRNQDDAILAPIPQYPLYSAAIQLLGGSLVPYDLDESEGWALSLGSLKAAVGAARAAGKCVRALVFINPGNPTGKVLPRSNLEGLIRFAHEERLVLMADEVYQELVYRDDRPFFSARKVLMDMGEPYSSSVELVSFHTVSKGTSGECGLRGGYYEMVNFHPGTIDQLYKVSSINLSPNSLGQVAMSCMVDPPRPGEPSHATWVAEQGSEFESLKRRAALVAAGFNALEGVSCSDTDGAMYSFPRLELPPKAIAAAKAAGKAPDAYYCLRLLEEEGIVCVPGSGFGQAEGTFHLRTTILPREEKMKEFVAMFRTFHEKFMAEFK